MTKKDLENQMLMAERIAFGDKEVALKFANRMMAEALVDLGYSDAVLVYKRLIDS